MVVELVGGWVGGLLTTVGVRAVERLVVAPQQGSDLAGEATDHLCCVCGSG